MLTSWLEAHEADLNAAASLVDTGATVEALDTLASAVQGPDLDTAIRWIAIGCTLRTLASDIEKALRACTISWVSSSASPSRISGRRRRRSTFHRDFVIP